MSVSSARASLGMSVDNSHHRRNNGEKKKKTMTRIERRLTKIFHPESYYRVGRHYSSAYDSDTDTVFREDWRVCSARYREEYSTAGAVNAGRKRFEEKKKKEKKKKKKRKEFLVFERKKKNVRRANSSSGHFKFQEIEDGLTEIEDVARWIIIRWWRGESHVTLIRVCFVYSRRVEREIEKTCIYSDCLIG